jgi:hypothetical protein
MLLPPANLFRDDFLAEFDLQRFRDYLFENSGSESSVQAAVSMGPLLMDVLMKEGGEGNEQDLEPFDPALLKPLQTLPPGKIPGIAFDPETSAHKSSQPLSIFSLPATTLTSSAGNSPKRRKLDTSQQNITIQHF